MQNDKESRPRELHPKLVERFEHEIVNQWKIVQQSIDMMNAHLQGNTGDSDSFWFGVDAALGALGNISKIFFAPKDAKAPRKNRCKEMREIFGVTEESLLLSREARNGFEHFDERLDTWFAKSTRKNLADRNIAPKGAISGLDASDFARNYDPESNIVTVFGKSLNFQELVSEVAAMVIKVQARSQA